LQTPAFFIATRAEYSGTGADLSRSSFYFCILIFCLFHVVD